METEPTAGGVDLGLVTDGISLSQDFGLWFGKSVFNGILAEIIQEKHSGHRAVTLVDVLELMVAAYYSGAEAYKEQTDPQQTYEAFYRSIHDRRCDTSDADWEAFRQRLSSDIATSCERLRNEKDPELHGISLLAPPKDSMVPPPTTDASSGASPSSTSLVSLHQQHSAGSLSANNGTAQCQQARQPQAPQPQALRPLANPVSASQTAVDMHRYTSVLNEHAALQGEKLTYEKKQLSLSPSSWLCTATFGQISGVGIGRNTTQAKHAASKKICELIDLVVL